MEWKRKLSGLLAGVMLLGTIPTTALAWDAPESTWQQADRSNISARFFVGSDVHIGRNEDASKKLKNALEAFYEVDPYADGVLLDGDVTNNGTTSEYQTLMSIINDSEFGKAGKVKLTMGNHEYGQGTMARFEEQTSQSANEVLYYSTSGAASTDASSVTSQTLAATVVKLSAQNYGGNYTNAYDMLKTALETANSINSSAPIIVLGHHGIQNTAYVTEEWYGNYGEGTTTDMVELMKQYPQVIHISGHSHSTLEDARSIWQDGGFTAIQDGTLGAYFENESGKVNPDTGEGSTYPADREVSSQALRIDVLKDGSVKIYRMNLTTGEYMYEDEPWTFSTTNLPYTDDRTSSAAPVFPEGATVTADEVTGNTAVIHFTAAQAGSSTNNDMIHEYWITLTPTEGGSSIVKKVFADYYEKTQKTGWSVKIKGLDSETEYDVSVRAVTSFGKKSAALQMEDTLTTATGYVPPYPAEAILDVDFSRDDSGADSKGHTQTVFGEPTFRTDETLNRTVAVFDGVDDGLRYSMTTEDYEKLQKKFTVELYYKPLDTKNNNPLGNTQSSGFCFEQKSGTNTLQFWAHINGSYQKPEVAVAQNEWNHIVGTYDGETVKIYRNGVLASTVSCSGTLSTPPLYLFLGGDTNSSGGLEYQANCEIALARVYTGTMTAEDVANAYAAVQTQTEETTLPDADILDVDFSTGSEADRSANQLTATKRGTSTVNFVQDSVLGKTVAEFDGSCGFSYPMSEQYSKLSSSMTFAVTFQYTSLPSSGEHDLLSNQQSGGFGLGTDDGKLTFFCHVGGGYKTPKVTAVATGEWHNAVGVFDGSSVKLYLDGELVSTVAASGTVGLPKSGATEVFIGGDSSANNALQFTSCAKIATARIYSQALTAEQVQALAESELPSGDTYAPVITFAAEPAISGKVGEAFTLPQVSVTDDSSVTTTITIQNPDGNVTTLTGADAETAMSGSQTVTLEKAGTYTVTYTAVDASGNEATKSFQVSVIDATQPVALPEADILDVDFQDGTAADHSATANTVSTVGSPVIQENAEMGKKVATFNGSYDAYRYSFDTTKYARMTNAVTMESVFCYEEVPTSGEHDIFSNQQSGGIGLGLENGRLQFYCNIEGVGYVQPNYQIEAGKWYHAVGVFDGSSVKLYINGSLVSEKSAGGTQIHWTSNTGARNFFLGADSGSNNNAEYFANGSVSVARLYSQAMTAEQVAALYAQLDPVMLALDGSISSLSLNHVCKVPVGTASNGAAVSVTVTDPNGNAVALTDGAFTPVTEGSYTISYTVEGSSVHRTLSVPAVDTDNLPVTVGIVAADQTAAGGKYNINLHINRDSALTVGKVSFDLHYDASVFRYEGAEKVKSNVTLTDDGNGTLHVEYTGTVPTEDFKNYSSTRLGKLTFAVQSVEGNQETSFTFENVDIDASTNKKVTEDFAVTVYGQSSLDLNGDGVIGAGDVALAETEEQRTLIAAQASIYPYKHVVMITMDGGGICFRPDQMYYVQNGTTILTSDSSILAKRTNEYAMQLFNEYCATSYTAKSETPTISAQNYTSLLHGKEYATAQSEYKIDNTKTGTYYYPDFGKTTAVYPSVFKALAATFPNRSNAAFAEWTQIVNGVVEPDAPTYSHGSTHSKGSLQDVADTIRSSSFHNMSLVYMQSDEMDGVGHSTGFYNDTYYQQLTKFDDYFKEVMDALEESGEKDETLVLFTSDHGGTAGGSHGGTTDQEYDVQIALGGQTIDSGKRLTGGTNHDPSVIALTALRAEVPSSMDGTADLLEQATLSQDELSKKNRDVETVTATLGTNVNALELTLSNTREDRTIRALDAVIDLGSATVGEIETTGTVLRQELTDGKLYLTISYESTPSVLARINLNGTTESAGVTEYMLGTSEGKEIYGDLVNTTGALDEENTVTVNLSGSEAVTVDDESVNYTVSVENAVNVATVTVKVTLDSKYVGSEIQVEGCNDFTVLASSFEEENGKLVGEIVVIRIAALTAKEDTALFTITAPINGVVGDAAATLTEAVVSSYAGTGEAFMNVVLGKTEAAVTVDYSRFDVNRDGVVNQLDLTRAQRYFGTDNKICDVSGNGEVGIEDLILILNNYSNR